MDTSEQIELGELKPGDKARVSSVVGTIPRLHELGLVPGTLIKVLRVAPLGDPVEIFVRDSRLCLRRSEMKGIMVVRES
ncbi:MAG: ferrous iron transport protein A [Fimbriimonadaceae bacterium]|nr:ferrous iron transport protein A [Fimbriimonadaceae bacterium]